MKKLVSLLALTIPLLVTSQPCLPDGITFTTQVQIDSFQINYPNCTEIEGSVEIYGDSITNLYGLNVLASVGGDLSISDNDMLTSLRGLDSLTFIGGSLSIQHNDILQSLKELEGLSTINSVLEIYMNSDLINLTGLDNITSVGSDLLIDLNFSLMNLSGLEKLTTIGGDLYIGGLLPSMWHGNTVLSNLNGIENLSSVGGDVVIAGNGSLSTCQVKSICDYLVSPNGNLDIYGNALGCNSPEEVEQACDSVSSVIESNIIQETSIHPNPFSSSTTIEYELQHPSNIQITICNQFGKQLEVIQQTQPAGKQQVVWNAEGKPAGIYFCVIKTESGSKAMKMIKLK